MTGAPRILPALPAVIAAEFDVGDFQVFREIPEDRDVGIVSLRGAVLVYDAGPLHREGILDGAYYVREHQRPTASMQWKQWLELEYGDAVKGSHGPTGLLRTTREVVQARRMPVGDRWGLRLASGITDGPYHDWAFGRDLVGKVVGMYRPN